MKFVKLFEQFIIEGIRAKEAYRDSSAIQTVIDKKRDIGFITIKASPMLEEEIWTMINDNGLKTIPVEGNAWDAYIYYRPTAAAKKKALELKKIAEKYGGYLSWEATEEESRRIGELLGYAKQDIDAYINKNYKK